MRPQLFKSGFAESPTNQCGIMEYLQGLRIGPTCTSFMMVQRRVEMLENCIENVSNSERDVHCVDEVGSRWVKIQ